MRSFNVRPQLEDEDTGLRDTLFWAIYGDMVLFDTYANAIAYQNGLQHAHERRDILVEYDGTVLVSATFVRIVPGTPIMVSPARALENKEMGVVRTESYNAIFCEPTRTEDMWGSVQAVVRERSGRPFVLPLDSREK